MERMSKINCTFKTATIRNYVMIDIPQYHFSSIILLQVNNIRFIIVTKV